MNKEFIPYEQALSLKELGFDEPCFGVFQTQENNRLVIQYFQKSSLKFAIHLLPAPTFSQAFRWFREKYGLHSWITMELGNKSTFCWVLSGEHISTQYKAYFHTYEEAELECLIKLIELVKEGAI